VAQTLLNHSERHRKQHHGKQRGSTMHVSKTYTAIGADRDRERSHTYFFMMNNLLYSRIDSGFPSNDEYFDEDVNVYLAGLLASLIDPASQAAAGRYIRTYDVQLFELVESMQNSYSKFQAYKANADFLIVSIGIFDNPVRMRPRSVPYMSIPREKYIGRGMTYYHLAQSYCRETYRRNTALEAVLGKLSSGFAKYLRILSLMRSEYLNMYRKITSGELFHLGYSIDHVAERGERGILYDEFLDAYSSYRRQPSPDARRALDDLAGRLRAIDPTFRFELE
jgi:hypothetical protein